MRIAEAEVTEFETTAGGHLPAAPEGKAPLFRMAAFSLLLHLLALGFLLPAAENPFATAPDRRAMPVIQVTLSPPGENSAFKKVRLPPALSKRGETAVHGREGKPGKTPAKRNTAVAMSNNNGRSKENGEFVLASAPAMTALNPSPTGKSAAAGDFFPGGENQAVAGENALTEAAPDSMTAKPRYLDTPPPVYPAEARSRGYEGTALLTVEILADGRTGQVLIKKSSGYAVLDRSAQKAVRSWRFEPARTKRIPRAMIVDIPIRFYLEDQR